MICLSKGDHFFFQFIFSIVYLLNLLGGLNLDAWSPILCVFSEADAVGLCERHEFVSSTSSFVYCSW